MRKIWITIGIALTFASTTGCTGPQYVYWKRTGSAPYQLANDGPTAQSRLQSDYAECATFSYVQNKNAAAMNWKKSDQSYSQWEGMQYCMYQKGWTYVTAGQGAPLPSNASLDPFKGRPIAPPPQPAEDYTPYYDSSMPSGPMPAPAIEQQPLPPLDAVPKVYPTDMPATTQEPIEIQ